MTPLYCDTHAQALIAGRLARHPDAALCLDLVAVYSRGGPARTVALRWMTTRRAARRPDLLRARGPHNVPLFVEPRLYRYLTWHPVRVRGERIGPFSRLFPVVDPLFVDRMRQWERQHPAIALPATAAA